MDHYTRPLYVLLIIFFTCCQCDKSSRRPVASKILPVLDLVEPEGSMYDPKPQDIDSTKLKRILGASYDSEIMSEEQPAAYSLFPNGTVKLALRRTAAGHVVPQGDPPKQIKRLHLQHVKLAEGKKINLKLGNKMRRRLVLLFLQ